jgi:CRISPR-associated endonuclease Csn1
MSKVLGLDLGTNSIGWALIDEIENKILGTGVRIFKEGINRDTKGGEISKNETRRNARQSRRQLFRVKLRKKKLINILVQYGMCPVSPEDFHEWFCLNPYECRAKAVETNISLLQVGRIFYHFAQHRGFKSNRKSAAKEDTTIYKGDVKTGKIGIDDTNKQLSEHTTLGTYLYSILPKENEPFENRERVRNRYTLRTMYEQEFDAIWDFQSGFYPKIMTNELRYQIGYRPATDEQKRTDGILFFQRPLRSQKSLLGKCRFERRKFFDNTSQKFYFSGKTRCPISHPEFEMFRTYQFLNGIQYGNEQKLNEDQKKILIEFLNSKDASIKFSELKKKLKLTEEAFNYSDDQNIAVNYTYTKFRKFFSSKVWDKKTDEEKHTIWHIFYNAEDNLWLKNYCKAKWNIEEKQIDQIDKIHLKTSYASLSLKAIRNISPFLQKGYLYNDAVILGGVKNAFGQNWNNLTQEIKINIENHVIEITNEKNKEGEAIEKIKNYLTSSFHLTNKELNKLYHHSQVIYDKKGTPKLPLPDNIRNPIVQKALFELRKIVNAIIDQYGKPDEIKIELARELKMPKKQRERIRLDNMEREGKNDEARVELEKHGLSFSRNNIHKYLLWKELQDSMGIAVCPYSGLTIGLSDLFNDNKFQIEHIVPYSVSLNDSLSNKTICEAKRNQEKGDRTPYQFFKSDAKGWEVAKERAKKIFAKKNYQKYKRFISKTNPDLDDFISRQLNDTRYICREAAEFVKPVCHKVSVLSGGVTSELRHLWGLNAILTIPIKVDPMPSGHYLAAVTGENRIVEIVKWSFQNKKEIINTLSKKGEVLYGFVKDGQFIPQKERSDHRHHAIDAVTIACTKQNYVKEIANWNQNYRSYENHHFPAPWQHFYNSVRLKIENMMISHEKTDKIVSKVSKTTHKNGKEIANKGIAPRGALHAETLYGQVVHPVTKEKIFVVRKGIEEITDSTKVEKIVDTTIRKYILLHLKTIMTDPKVLAVIENQLQGKKLTKDQKYTIPAGAFIKKDVTSGKKIPLIKLPNKNGEPVPVYKVRIENRGAELQPIRTDRFPEKPPYIETDSNSYIILYGEMIPKKNEKRDYLIIPLLKVAQIKSENSKRKKIGLAPIPLFPLQKNGIPYLMTLSIGDMIIVFDEHTDEIDWSNQALLFRRLFLVRKSEKGGEINVVRHNASNVKPDKDPSVQDLNSKEGVVMRRTYNTIRCIKVIVTILGIIKPALEA